MAVRSGITTEVFSDKEGEIRTLTTITTELFCISDEEGDSDDGRISPCTFRLWAEGCAKRNGITTGSKMEAMPVSYTMQNNAGHLLTST